MGLIWKKPKQLLHYRSQDLAGRLRALVVIEEVPAVDQDCQATVIGEGY